MSTVVAVQLVVVVAVVTVPVAAASIKMLF